MHGIPFAFLSGYEQPILPPEFRPSKVFDKPIDWAAISPQVQCRKREWYRAENGANRNGQINWPTIMRNYPPTIRRAKALPSSLQFAAVAEKDILQASKAGPS
jgi:hypothetical protein